MSTKSKTYQSIMKYIVKTFYSLSNSNYIYNKIINGISLLPLEKTSFLNNLSNDMTVLTGSIPTTTNLNSVYYEFYPSEIYSSDSIQYSRLVNVPSFYPGKLSTTTIDSNLNMGSYTISILDPTVNSNPTTKNYVDTAITKTIPIGAILLWSLTSLPTGWLACDGSAVNSTNYPKLYALMTNLPDLRGVFIRGLDSGKNLDSGRTINSTQNSSFAYHNHSISTDGDHNHTISTTGSHQHDQAYATSSNTGPFDKSSVTYPNAVNITTSGTATAYTLHTGFSGDHTHILGNAGSHTHTIGYAGTSGITETRPINVALIYIIKAL